MKKIIKYGFSCLLIMNLTSVLAQTELHEAKITGNISLGQQEVTAIHDLETDCIYKSEPHKKGLFVQGELVQLQFKAEKEQVEVIKPTLPEVVLVHRNECKKIAPIKQPVSNICEPYTYTPINPEMELKFDNILTDLAIGLIDLTKNEYFRNIVVTESVKEFDGDVNVLINNLEKVVNNSSFKLSNELRNSLMKYSNTLNEDQNRDYLSNINNFKSFDYYEETLYPQIYLPFSEQVDYSQRPIIAINLNNEEITAGYELITNTDGTETVSKISINEQMAENRPVWVISVNERVDNNGQLSNSVFACSSSPKIITNAGTNYPIMSQRPVLHGAESTPVNSPNQTMSCTDGIMNGDETGKDCGGLFCPPCSQRIHLEITEVNVSDKKEPWINGKAELNWFAMFSYDTDCSNFQKYGFDDNHYMKISKKQLNTWLIGDNNLGLITKDNESWIPDDGQEGIIVFYEADKRVKFAREININPQCYNNNNEFKLIIYSKEDIYGATEFEAFGTPNDPSATNSLEIKEESLEGMKFKFGYKLK